MSEQPLDELVRARRAKLEKLKALGLPHTYEAVDVPDLEAFCPHRQATASKTEAIRRMLPMKSGTFT